MIWATAEERGKQHPTYRDLNYIKLQPAGISLNAELYRDLMNAIYRDCECLRGTGATDYSLLVGIRYLGDNEPFDGTLHRDDKGRIIMYV